VVSLIEACVASPKVACSTPSGVIGPQYDSEVDSDS